MNAKRQFRPSLEAQTLEKREAPATISPVTPGAPFVPKFLVPPTNVRNVPPVHTNGFSPVTPGAPFVPKFLVPPSNVYNVPPAHTNALTVTPVFQQFARTNGFAPGFGLTGTGSNTGAGVYGYGNPYYLGARR